MARRLSPSARRERFGQWLRKRFALRGFMTWIVVGTTGAGMGINALLFHAGMSELWLRTLIAVVPTYFVFLLLVRVWLGAFSGKRVRERAAVVDESNADTIDRVDTAIDVVDTAAFVADIPVYRSARVPASKSDWSLGDVDLDGEGIALAAVFGLLVLVLAAIGGYLIWEAPAILAETLFEFTLASAMAKRLGSTEESGSWLGHLVRRTWIPFVAVLVVTGLFAAVVANLRPDAQRLPELWRPAIEAPRIR